MSNKATGGHTQFGANFVFAPSGLYYFLQHVQAGELYITGVNEVTATGYFDPTYDGDVRGSLAPHVMVTPVADPSGRIYVSASGADTFVATFSSTPLGGLDLGPFGVVTVPYHIANWLAVL